MKPERWNSRPTDIAAVIGFGLVFAIVALVVLIFVMVLGVNYILTLYEVSPIQ